MEPKSYRGKYSIQGVATPRGPDQTGFGAQAFVTYPKGGGEIEWRDTLTGTFASIEAAEEAGARYAMAHVDRRERT